MKDLLDILQAMAENKGRTDNPLELFLDMSERVVKYVAGAFGAKMDEVAILLLTSPARLRVRARELPYLALFGIAGLAFVQWFYFLAIHRLAIGIEAKPLNRLGYFAITSAYASFISFATSG